MVSNYVDINLGNRDLFILHIGKRRTKKELLSLPKGDIPIISARLDRPFGYISSNTFVCLKNKTVLWNIDSSRWDTKVINSHEKFIPTDHCGYIEILNRNIVPEYIAYKLYEYGLHLGFKHEYRASLTNIGNISFPIPVSSYGDFDVAKQENIAQRYFKYLEAREKMLTTIDDLASKHIRFSSSSKFARINIGDFMSFKKGKAIYTEKFCKSHSGNYPVYSAGTRKNNTIGFINTFDYERECLKITTNGFYAGTVEYVPKSKFSLNGDVGILYLTKDSDNKFFDYRYLEYALQNARDEYGFSWNNKPNEEDIKNIEVSVPVKNGEWDMEEQKRIALKFVEFQEAMLKLQADVDGLNKQFIKVNF